MTQDREGTPPRASLPGSVVAARATPWVRGFGLLLITFCIYLILAPLGRQTVFPETGLSLMWLPTAFGVGMLARVARKNQPFVAAGIVMAEAIADLFIFKFPMSTTPLFVAANLGEQLLVAEILRRFDATRLRRSRDVVVLFIAALVGGLLGATVGAVAGVQTFGGTYPEAWRAWYLGGLTATVIIAPFVLSVRWPRRLAPARILEFTVALGLVVAVSIVTFTNPVSTDRLGFIAVIAPLLGWLGFRFGIIGVSTACPLIIYIGTIAATNSFGPFSNNSPTVSDVLTTQILLVLAAVTIYCAAGVEEARRVAAGDSLLANEQLRYQATHDAVTGLSNRFTLLDRVKRASSEDHRRSLTVIFLDLDGFRQVNDSFGHQIGDLVLAAVGVRLRDSLPDAIAVSRIGGDEFVAVLQGLSPSEANATADQIRAAVSAPIKTEERDYLVGACIGYSTSTSVSRPEELIRRADVALNDAKSQGPNCTSMYSAALDEATHRRAHVKELLETGLTQGWVRPWGQAIYSAESGEVAAVEILARLDAPNEAIPPIEFIPIAESTGLIIELGRQMLQGGLRQITAGSIGSISVNASARELGDPDFALGVVSAIADHGVNPHDVTIEVTETSLIDSLAEPQRQLEALRAHGVRIALDDFGTGYSSLTFLRHLPHDIVKIDRQFISHLETSLEDQAIAKALIHVSHELGKVVVAEGVENASQLAVLREMGCDLVQGFYLARPEPLDAHTRAVPRQRVTGSEPVITVPPIKG